MTGRRLNAREREALRSAIVVLEASPTDPMDGETILRQMIADLLAGVLSRHEET